MRSRSFTAEVRVAQPLDVVFPFFADARNLNELTPPWLNFHVITAGAVTMKAGAVIEYGLRVHGLPLRWRTLIAAWEPPHRFVDEQLRGPYRQWIHEHTFESDGSGTIMRDRVTYAVPGWIIEPLINRLLVRPDIEKIFAWRTERVRALFGGAAGETGSAA